MLAYERLRLYAIGTPDAAITLFLQSLGEQLTDQA
jgi:hypothetical protein